MITENPLPGQDVQNLPNYKPLLQSLRFYFQGLSFASQNLDESHEIYKDIQKRLTSISQVLKDLSHPNLEFPSDGDLPLPRVSALELLFELYYQTMPDPPGSLGK